MNALLLISCMNTQMLDIFFGKLLPLLHFFII